jgi:hypothetical protein
MAVRKIHCEYYEVIGVNWNSLDQERRRRIIKAIENSPLLGSHPDTYGFVGVSSRDNAVGGFFALQYEAELLHYDRQKKLSKDTDFPFERVFFVLFVDSGKVVIQNRVFVNLPLNMDRVLYRFTKALSEIFKISEVGYALNLNRVSEVYNPPELFQQEFRRSTRVINLTVEYPNGERIRANFVYYNPKVERNAIIRDSHMNDYANFRRVDLEAEPVVGDIKKTHIGRDLIEIGKPVKMKYEDDGEQRVLRDKIPAKFEIYVDTDAERIDPDVLAMILMYLRNEVGLRVSVPILANDSSSEQMGLFGLTKESGNGEEEYEN